MLRSTFQIAPGCGAVRERRLWRAGIARWCEYGAASGARPLRLPAPADAALRRGIEAASTALAGRDVEGLAALLPQAEHWRLLETFGTDAAYLDIETSDDVVGFAGISAIGVLDRRGLRLLLAERDLEQFPELAQRWSLLVTFNGLSFDVPILQRAFPDWRPPLAHVDLRHVLARLGHTGGLKAIERSLASLRLVRPAHLEGLDGGAAGWLFQRWRRGDREALRRFAEYNLYDVIGLPTLAAYAHNALVERHVERAPVLRAVVSKLPVPGRGNVLYDVSKILLGL